MCLESRVGFKARADYRALLRRRFGGRRIILAYGQLAAIGKEVELLKSLGASEVFVLAQGQGTGVGSIDYPHRVVGPPSAATLMEDIRGFEAALAALEPEVLDGFDPDRTALVIRPLWGSLLEVAGRPVYNARQPSWVALEDKVVIDAVWDRAGVTRAPYRIVDADPAVLAAAHGDLDDGLGTVWAGDAREGWHGGAGLTCWVAGRDSADRAAARLIASCDRVRVMPFLEGIPCSIHGMVTPGGVAALRPVEMITLRDRRRCELRYFGTSTIWDPPPDDREAMRGIAVRVGELLRAEVGYRGSFTIDGVMTAAGFLPTELNPRFGAGMFRFMPGCPELPLYFVDAAMCAGEPWDFRIAELEAALVAGADATRVAACNAWDPSSRDETSIIELSGAPGALRPAAAGDPVIGQIVSGPSALGSFHRVSFDPGSLEIGRSVAPVFLEALALCDRELGTGFGPLEAARSVR